MLILPLLLTLQTASAAPATDGAWTTPQTTPQVKEYGDWSVGCDNALRCTAISTPNQEQRSVWIEIRREGGQQGELSVSVHHLKYPVDPGLIEGRSFLFNGPAPLGADGTFVNNGNEQIDLIGTFDSDGQAIFTGTQARQSVRLLLHADDPTQTSSFAVITARGAMPISSRGIKEVLAYMNSQQQRCGIDGTEPECGQPPRTARVPPQLPVIQAIRSPRKRRSDAFGSATAFLVRSCFPPDRAPDLKLMRKIGRSAQSFGYYPLGAGADLFIIMCHIPEPGPDPSAPHAIMIRGGEHFPLSFDTPAPIEASNAIQGLHWDEQTARLTTRGNSIACGCIFAQTYVWTGNGFAMVEASRTVGLTWLPIWRASVSEQE